MADSAPSPPDHHNPPHRMGRRYTALEFADLVSHAAHAVPDVYIGADVMVGFPGEGTAEFEATHRLLVDSPIAYAHVFRYSERAGTPAANLSGKVDPRTRHRRSVVVRRISTEKFRRFYKAQLGKRLAVLFEEKKDGYWFGYTGNYIRVAARSNKRIRNTEVPVRLERFEDDIMFGALQDI